MVEMRVLAGDLADGQVGVGAGIVGWAGVGATHDWLMSWLFFLYRNVCVGGLVSSLQIMGRFAGVLGIVLAL